MIKSNIEEFKIDWILKNKIAIGRPPNNNYELEVLKQKGIKNILNLCTEEEAPIPNTLLDNFEFRRYPLPDHKVKKNLDEFQLTEVIAVIEQLLKNGPVFIHCYASIERSPFICIAWLVLKEKISFLNALDHVKESHIESNPMRQHLNVLMNLNN